MNRHIAYLAYSTLPSSTANSVHVMHMSSAFASLGFQVSLFAQDGLKNGLNLYDYYGVSNNFSVYKRKMGRIPKIRVLQYSIASALHAARLCGKKSFYYGRDPVSLALLACMGFGVVYESHGLPMNRLVSGAERILFAAPGFLRLVAISNALKDIYLSRNACLKERKVLVAHDGAGDPWAQDGPPSPPQGERLRVGYVGSLYEGRGVELMLSLAALNDSVDFIIIGGSQKEIEKYERSGISPNVFFLGYVPHSELKAHYENLDILLAPYARCVRIHGNFGDTSQYMSPLKIFEYMASGRPFIASRHAAIQEVVNDAEDCILAEPQNVSEWDAALKRLIADRQLRLQLSKKAREHFLKHHTWRIRACRILSELGLGHV